jgi:hypothetical protein
VNASFGSAGDGGGGGTSNIVPPPSHAAESPYVSAGAGGGTIHNNAGSPSTMSRVISPVGLSVDTEELPNGGLSRSLFSDGLPCDDVAVVPGGVSVDGNVVGIQPHQQSSGLGGTATTMTNTTRPTTAYHPGGAAGEPYDDIPGLSVCEYVI